MLLDLSADHFRDSHGPVVPEPLVGSHCSKAIEEENIMDSLTSSEFLNCV